jgi:Ca2+-binding RTX toxin-like protein
MATRKWGNELLVNTTVTGNQDQSTVTALADGGFVIGWREDGLTDSVTRWQRYDAAGLRVGAERTAGNFGGDQTNPVIVTLQGDALWIVQQDDDGPTDRDIEGDVYGPAGGFIRAQTSDGSSGDTTAPAATSLGANGAVSVFVKAFYDINNNVDHTIIKTQLFDATGVAGPFGVPSDAFAGVIVDEPAVAASKDGSKYVVTWTNDQSGALNNDIIMAGVFNADGTEFAPKFTVNGSVTGDQNASKVAWLDNSRFVVACTGNIADLANGGDGSFSSVKYSIYNADGSLFLAEHRANTTIFGNQNTPEVAALPDGGFVIAWTDASGTGGDSSVGAIRLQSFNALGEKVGGEILVNTTTAASQFDVHLAALADGRVVVTWTDGSGSGGDISGLAVRAQIIDPRDGTIDGTAGADTLYGNDVTDFISAGDGADTVYGLAGVDTIYGGDGGDLVNGGRGDDTVYGGNDGDNIRGDAGDDELYGEAGSDTLLGGLGADFLNGGDGFDFANYHFARGVIIDMNDPFASTGEAFGDSFFSIEGIVGSAGFADTILGDVNPNIIYGQGGADILDGRGGNDTLYGGAAGDTMTGGAGPDRFLYVAATEGGDTITDFAAGDKIQLTAAAFGLVANPGAGYPLAPAAFLTSAGHVATTVNTRIMVDTTSHTLWYDSDGTGAVTPILLATFSNNYNPIIADFLVT